MCQYNDTPEFSCGCIDCIEERDYRETYNARYASDMEVVEEWDLPDLDEEVEITGDGFLDQNEDWDLSEDELISMLAEDGPRERVIFHL